MKPCPVDLWESLAREDESATFFQTPAWHRIAARHFRAESAPLLFEFPDGPACLPLLRDRRWGRWRYFSPFGTYTAVVCPRVLSVEERTVIERVLSGLNVHLVSSPFTQNPVRVGTGTTLSTHCIDLTAVDPDHPGASWERDARRRARKARADGWLVRPGAGEKDWTDYVALYRASLARWGDRATVAYPDSLFRDLRARLEGRPEFRFWLAERDGVTGAGFLGFNHNRHAALWHAAADDMVFRHGVVQFLYHEMIADAARRGFAVFDLLGSGGLTGVEAFKESLGAQRVEFDSYLKRTGVIGLIARSVSRRRRS